MLTEEMVTFTETRSMGVSYSKETHVNRYTETPFISSFPQLSRFQNNSDFKKGHMYSRMRLYRGSVRF